MIATITPMYNAEPFVRAWAKQNAVFDLNIVLLGNRPFQDYLEAGFVKEERDNTEKILHKEFPHVKIVNHDFQYYCGGLFNLGMEVAESLGADIIYKSEPDMYLTEKDMTLFLEKIQTLEYQTLQLFFQKKTMMYVDFNHGVTQALWDVGNDPFVVKKGVRFVENGTQIRTHGDNRLIDWDDFMVHHLSGFKLPQEETIRQIEAMSNFTGWSSCPQEIQELFYV